MKRYPPSCSIPDILDFDLVKNVSVRSKKVGFLGTILAHPNNDAFLSVRFVRIKRHGVHIRSLVGNIQQGRVDSRIISWVAPQTAAAIRRVNQTTRRGTCRSSDLSCGRPSISM
jgi:hypothetical protein